MSEVIEEGFKIEQSRTNKILDNIIVIGKQLSNQRTGYQKEATVEAAFLKKASYFYGYTWLENIILAAIIV